MRLLAGQNVNVIKVLVTGAILTHNSNHLAREFTYEELAAIVDEANNFGLKVAAHGHNVNGIKNAVRAGVEFDRARQLPGRRGDRDDEGEGHLSRAHARGAQLHPGESRISPRIS